jgi:uncharacterized protein (TIGR02145 family)
MKTLGINWLIITFIIGMISFSACTKVDRTNPYDDKANLSPDEWAPQNLSLEIIDSISIQISWNYNDRNIEGFEIERRTNNGAWESPFDRLDETFRVYTDKSVTFETGQIVEYRINAFAGINKSSKIICNTENYIYDYDNNLYKTVKIGTQYWMAENLKVSHYRNGEAIPNVTDASQWSSLSSGAYCWYNNDVVNKNIYGVLYNYYTVVDSRNLCPVGWHIPSDDEWSTLTTYLGGKSVAGGKMKETGTTHWQSPNTNATNVSGFRGLSGGYRYDDGTFDGLGYYGGWWSSAEDGAGNAWDRYLYYSTGDVGRGYGGKKVGFSVRCVKD